MRCLSLVLLVAACGGQAKGPTTPSNGAPDQVGTQGTPPPPAKDQSCANRPDDFGPFVLTADQAASRYGAQAKHYADAPSSKEKAIEVCGIPASQQWLIGTTCADGSRAYANGMAASQSRAGNVGPGGRCGSIIDHYVAKCPEAAYDVFIDMYMCGPSESF